MGKKIYGLKRKESLLVLLFLPNSKDIFYRDLNNRHIFFIKLFYHFCIKSPAFEKSFSMYTSFCLFLDVYCEFNFFKKDQNDFPLIK